MHAEVVRVKQSQIPRKNDAFSAPPGTRPIGTCRSETPLQNRCPRLMSRTPLLFSSASCLLKGVGFPTPSFSVLLQDSVRGMGRFQHMHALLSGSKLHVSTSPSHHPLHHQGAPLPKSRTVKVMENSSASLTNLATLFSLGKSLDEHSSNLGPLRYTYIVPFINYTIRTPSIRIEPAASAIDVVPKRGARLDQTDRQKPQRSLRHRLLIAVRKPVKKTNNHRKAHPSTSRTVRRSNPSCQRPETCGQRPERQQV